MNKDIPRTIKLNDEQFDLFIAASNKQPLPLSKKMKDAASALDSEGFVIDVRKYRKSCTNSK